MLDDGVYDVVVVDAAAVGGDADGDGGDVGGAGGGVGDPGAGTIHLDLTILAGPHKGEVVAVLAVGLGRDPLDLLAEPGVLTVEGGQPRFALDG